MNDQIAIWIKIMTWIPKQRSKQMTHSNMFDILFIFCTAYCIQKHIFIYSGKYEYVTFENWTKLLTAVAYKASGTNGYSNFKDF